MAYKKIGDWSELLLDGILGWIHRIVMFLTFPLRHFWSILISLAAVFLLLIIVALYCGVPFKQVGAWYKSMMPAYDIIKINNTAKNGEKTTYIKAKDDEAETLSEETQLTTSFQVKTKPHRENQHFVIWHVDEIKSGHYNPQSVVEKSVKQTIKNTTEGFIRFKQKIKEQIKTGGKKIKHASSSNLQVQQVQADLQNVALSETSYYSGKLTDYYENLENRSLIYQSKPDILIGVPTIRGANSLYLNNVFLFLYGIYTDPRRYNVASAEQYLRDLTANTKIYCAVVAYTAHYHTATALCFANGIFINKSLVEQNLADNVALK